MPLYSYNQQTEISTKTENKGAVSQHTYWAEMCSDYLHCNLYTNNVHKNTNSVKYSQSARLCSHAIN